MMQLIPIVVGITVTIIVAIALFSVFPSIIQSFRCPTAAQVNGSAGGTVSASVQAWIDSCTTLQTQTTVVPILISLSIVIAAIVIVARMLA